MEDAAWWPGVLDSALLNASATTAMNRLADAAKVGDWRSVAALVGARENAVNVNQWRAGGRSWFTPLHQAAWHGAPSETVTWLIERGALRSLRDAKGRTAHDIAVERGHPGALVDLFVPPQSALSPDRIRALDLHLASVIDTRIQGEHIAETYRERDLRRVLRYPSVEVLHELPGKRVWFPVPGMYGGFHIMLREQHLYAESWIRVVDGSGEAHVITHEGPVLVDRGFV